MTAYRIVKREFAGSAFSGEGAKRYGGRWNSAGVPLVYTSSTVSLALLEWRAHLAQWPAPPVVIIEVFFEDALIWTPPRLPKGWTRTPAPPANAHIGDKWAASCKSAVLRLPSAIVPDEFNYLINPLHRDFPKIWTGKPRLLRIDPRLGPLAVP